MHEKNRAKRVRSAYVSVKHFLILEFKLEQNKLVGSLNNEVL